jgi:tetratricopeptide (TPR) repeat protein
MLPRMRDQKHPPRPPRAYDEKGALLYWEGVRDAKAGRNDVAAHKMTEGLGLMRSVPVPEYGPIALLYIDLAVLYDSMGNQEKVESVLKEMDSMPQGELAEGLARARIRLKHSDKEGAERILLELSQRYPNSSLILNPLGDLEFDMKRYGRALEYYQRASAGWYADAQLHISMAQSLEGMGRNREALDQCRPAMAMAPRDRLVLFSCAKIQNDIESK